MPKFMSSHKLPPGGMSKDQVCQMGSAAQQETGVKPYRSFLNLKEGKAFCIIEAAHKEKVVEFFKKVGMPFDEITQVELEGEAGAIKDA